MPPTMSTDNATPLLGPEFLAQLERLELVSRQIFRGRMRGERRSPRKGQSVEFADFRNYVPGDDLRRVDWNLYARLDRLFLKLFLEEEDLHFYTLLDCSLSMQYGEPSKLHFAKQLAAALGYIGLTRSDRVKIDTLSPIGQGAPALRGRASLWRLIDRLEKLEPAGTTSLAAGIKRFCLQNPGRGVVVLLSDLMDKQGFEEGLRLLAAQQMDVYVIHILSREELDPAVTGDLRLIDCEDQETVEITASAPLLARYQQTLQAFLAAAKDFCHRRGMMYLMADTTMPADKLVLDYMRRRGLVR